MDDRARGSSTHHRELIGVVYRRIFVASTPFNGVTVRDRHAVFAAATTYRGWFILVDSLGRGAKRWTTTFVDGHNRRRINACYGSLACGRTANRETTERARLEAENCTRTTRFLVALWRPDVERAVLGAASHAYRPAAPLIGERPLPRMQGTTALIRDPARDRFLRRDCVFAAATTMNFDPLI